MIAKEIKNNTIIKTEEYYVCLNVQIINDRVKLELRNIKNNIISTKIFSINEEIMVVKPTKKEILYTNIEDNNAIFLLNETQYMINLEFCKNELEYIKNNTNCNGYFVENILVSILPFEKVVLKVEKIERKNSSWEIFNLKNVMLETSVWVRVPLNIQKGNLIEIDTKTNEFIKIIEE